MWAGESVDRPAWYATASTDTPVALLTAVTECVSDPSPLPRWRQGAYSYVEGLAQLTPILPPGPPPSMSHWPPPAARPRWSTTSRPTLPGPRR
ncbi:DUF317 domain-containing protein [Streptomyces sp. NPDC059153]|uniref:DUF317 domain-containing protein n=1 Tax=Streptomyces sp. NPDC059153 TaxID=3346743 RepID=UPI0036A1E320